MTGPGRPPVGPVVKVRIDPDMLDQLDAYAARYGMKRSEAMRNILEIGLRHFGD